MIHSQAPDDLERFVEAQEGCYETALAEVQRGQKRTHWMWYIFPQFAGLGYSQTSKHFAIKSLEEARAYLNHPVLGPRLVACMEATLGVKGRSAYDIFGSPDDSKLKSCATLFAHISPAGSVFEQVLDQFFAADRDAKTLRLLGQQATQK